MKRTHSLAAAVFLVGTLGLASHTAAQNIKFDRTVTFSKVATQPGTAAPDTGSEYRQDPVEEGDLKKLIRGSISSARVSSAHVPRPNDLEVAGAGAATGFNGITQREQRLADGGNQFSIEPPDQGLAVGNGYVVEAVNLALRIRPATGATGAAVVSLNRFFFQESGIIRATATTPAKYGHFVSDPKAYFHAATGHWFVTILSIDLDPNTGAFQGRSRLHVAVSQTADPRGAWRIYSIETANTGKAGHVGCPCFGDQPLIGADANGFYITTNEFPIFVGGFNGAQVYAISINDLENAAVVAPRMKTFDNLPLAEGPAYTLQPAIAPPGVAYDGGTAYFLSALDFTATLDDRIAVWALSNTAWLSSGTGATPSLQSLVIASQSYGQPPDSQQKPGPTPLGDLIKGLKIATEHLPLIAGNDDRMQQVMFDGANLWGALNTVVKPENGPTRVGTAYFVVQPTITRSGALAATIVRQGYLSVNNNSVLYPSVAVNSDRVAAIGLTLVGPDYYPSAAYVRLSGSAAPNTLNIAAAGAGPEDGFTGYVSQNDSRTARWGDYSAATVDEAGNLWFATEYIPAVLTTRPLPLANWGTYIGKITP
jgi:hypothetical protein